MFTSSNQERPEDNEMEREREQRTMRWRERPEDNEMESESERDQTMRWRETRGQ